MAAPGLVESWLEVFDLTATDLRAWGLAWARVAPAVTLVPAFGLRALPAPARAALGLSVAACIAPALTPIASTSKLPWPVLLLQQMALGLPVALVAAVGIWTLVMVGGVVDDLRGARAESSVAVLESPIGPTGVLMGLLGCWLFLQSGGPARIAEALIRPSLEFKQPLLGAAIHLTQGIQIALAVAAPLIAASLVLQLASALVTRAANPAHLQPVLEPLKSLALLGILALLLDRLLAASAGLLLRLP